MREVLNAKAIAAKLTAQGVPGVVVLANVVYSTVRCVCPRGDPVMAAPQHDFFTLVHGVEHELLRVHLEPLSDSCGKAATELSFHMHCVLAEYDQPLGQPFDYDEVLEGLRDRFGEQCPEVDYRRCRLLVTRRKERWCVGEPRSRRVFINFTRPEVLAAPASRCAADNRLACRQNERMVSQTGEVPKPSAELPTRAELLAALSVAIDLGLGQPAEHMLRSALIATRIADRLGLGAQQRDSIYYTTLIMWIGCHADSHELARWFGDDIAVRHDSYLVDWSGLPYLRFLLNNVARGEPLLHRLSVMASLFVNARGQLSRLIHSHCMSAALLAERLGLGADVQTAVAFTFERYDGGGLPAGAHGDAIPIQMRVAQLADMVEVHERTFGVEGAVAMARHRRGGQFDPRVVDAFVANAETVLAGPAAGHAWVTALREAPDRHQRLDAQSLDSLLIALGDFVDLKLPFTLGHSREVARLAADAAVAAGLDPDSVELTRRAGHVHDLGRIGVSNQIWSKPGDLTAAEFERVRLHPYFTVRILSHVQGLERVAEVAGNHHECLDGSGYPRGLAGTALSRPARVLAAAVSYQSACEPRPYRDAFAPEAAARRLRERVRAGTLDPIAADAVLHAAGHRSRRSNLHPDGLTSRELEILCLVAQGASNKQIAESLVISEKTVRNHVERTYAKIGVSNRIGASMYALRHGLVSPLST